MLHLGAAREWDPPVLTTSAIDQEGVENVWQAVEDHRQHLDAGGALATKRRARLLREVEALAAERFRVRVAAALEADDGLVEDLLERRIDPYGAAAMLERQALASP